MQVERESVAGEEEESGGMHPKAGPTHKAHNREYGLFAYTRDWRGMKSFVYVRLFVYVRGL
jgi:hypothetical protein